MNTTKIKLYIVESEKRIILALVYRFAVIDDLRQKSALLVLKRSRVSCLHTCAVLSILRLSHSIYERVYVYVYEVLSLFYQ